MPYPLTIAQLQEQIARETARMSYPGSMSRGTSPVVKEGTKKAVEDFFVTKFPWKALWANAISIAGTYDTWHDQIAQDFSLYLQQCQCLANPRNQPYAVATKFLNTFMHQLMKYDQFRPVWGQLHLPLDARVIQSFHLLTADLPRSTALPSIIHRVGHSTAYAILPNDYIFIQGQLWNLITELNGRSGVAFQVISRIELNYL